MTIKPRKKPSGRIFGTRRQWRRGGAQLGTVYTLDFETRSSFGFDFGRKDESAMVLATHLPSGRILFTPIRPPTKEEIAAALDGYRMVFSSFHLAPHHKSLADALQLGETVIETGMARKIGKSPALAAPYGANKSVDEPDAT